MRRPPWEKGESYDERLKWQLLLKNEVFTRSKRLFYRRSTLNFFFFEEAVISLVPVTTWGPLLAPGLQGYLASLTFDVATPKLAFNNLIKSNPLS